MPGRSQWSISRRQRSSFVSCGFAAGQDRQRRCAFSVSGAGRAEVAASIRSNGKGDRTEHHQERTLLDGSSLGSRARRGRQMVIRLGTGCFRVPCSERRLLARPELAAASELVDHGSGTASPRLAAYGCHVVDRRGHGHQNCLRLAWSRDGKTDPRHLRALHGSRRRSGGNGAGQSGFRGRLGTARRAGGMVFADGALRRGRLSQTVTGVDVTTGLNASIQARRAPAGFPRRIPAGPLIAAT